MKYRQRGLSLVGVAIFSAGFAALALAALFSMRYDRNLFAEGWSKVAKLAGSTPAQPALDSARQALGGGAPTAQGGELRKCVIDGKAVVSNTDCSDQNRSSRALKVHVTSGFEAPKVPVKVEAAATSDPMLDKAIEKQMH